MEEFWNYHCFKGGNPFSGGNPFGQNVDPEDILKTFFGGRDSPFGFATSSRGFEDFNEIQQVGFKFSTMLIKSILWDVVHGINFVCAVF